MRFILNNLTRRPLRSFLAILGVAIGIAAVVALTSLARGFRAEIDDLVTRLRGDLIVRQVDRLSAQSSRITLDQLAAIRELPGVGGVSGYTVQLFTFGALRVPVYGFEPTEPVLQKVEIVDGRGLRAGGAAEVLIGVEAARNLGVAAGEEITIPPTDPAGLRLPIVGVYRTGSRYQDFGCIVPRSLAQRVAQMPDHVMMCAVDVAAGADAERVRDAIREGVPGLDVRLAREFTDSLDDLQLLIRFAWAVSVIAALVGAIGVLNTMLMSVIERTREIGMLLALGWSKARVLGMVLAEGLLVSALGGAAGLGLGVALVDLVSRVLQDLPIVPGHDADLFARALALALGLGAFGSLLPAWKASRMSPVEALRHE